MARGNSKTDTGANLGFEAKLWQAADALRNNMDAAEYKHVVLGLIFLKYISDAFEAKHTELEAQRKQGADPEDRDEYLAANIFWVPKEARWQHLKASAPQSKIGTIVDDAMAAAGLKKPDISILSDEFLAEVRGMRQRNLAIELLQKLLKGEIKARGKRNVVQARSFAELLEQAVRKYQNRAIETAQVIEELIALARDMRAANARGEELKLTEEELAFSDALEKNDSAVKVLGDETLRDIARELVQTVRANVTIDWTIRENVRAQLRVLVKRILRRYGYPPDLQEKATLTVLEQAEVLSELWAAA